MTKKAEIADIDPVDLVFLEAVAEASSFDFGASLTRPEKHSRHLVPAPQAKQYLDQGVALKVEDIKWTPKTAPAEYLEQNPNGKSAQVARILMAHPRLAKERVGPSSNGTGSDDSSEPSDA